MKYIMLNKKRGFITAKSDPRHKTVMELLPTELYDEVFPVGRLDKDTEGFLLMTNDGSLAFSLMKPENLVEKTYFFYALGSIDDEKVNQIENGVKIYDKSDFLTSRAKFIIENVCTISDIKEYLSDDDEKKSRRRSDLPAFCARLTITEGKKHQVKRMLRAVGCKVVYLKRESIAGVTLDPHLKEGEHRYLTDEEVSILKFNALKSCK